jgi:ABC-type branched-subunit amino acid transport system substrate-binding protein
MMRRYRLPYVALAVIAVLTASCAGDVGKYRNYRAQGDGGSLDGQPIGDPGLPLAGPGATTGPAPVGSVAPGMGAVPSIGPSASAGPGQSSSNPTSGPVAVQDIGATTGVTDTTITVGALYPKSGAYTGLAKDYLNIMQAAFDEAGPINGRKVIVKGYDDGTSDAATIQTSEKQAQGEVFAMESIVGESNVVVAPLANRDKMPVLMGNIDEKVAEPLRYAFALMPYVNRQAKILPSFIKNELKAGGKRIGIVYETTSTETTAKNTFKSYAKSAGLQVVYEQPISQSQSTCTNEAANMQAHQVELIVMMNGPLGAICMLRDAKALGYSPTWTGPGTTWNLNVVATGSGGAANGVRMLGASTTLDTPAGKHYAQVMQKAGITGADTNDIDLLVYDLARTFIRALQLTGRNLGRDAFVRTMETQINGWDSGYLPPPTFGPGNRTGALGVSSELCQNNNWTTPKPGWHRTF